jgi:lia operon protein LiaG
MAGFYFCCGSSTAASGAYEQRRGEKMKKTCTQHIKPTSKSDLKLFGVPISFLAFGAMTIMCPAAISANGGADMVNDKTFNLSAINTVSIFYDSGKVIFLEGQSDQISFKEYLNSDNEKYFAQIMTNGNEVSIKCGARPLFRHLRARLEVYLPPSFEGKYQLSLGSGMLEAETDINAAETVNISVSSGSLRLQKVNAKKIKIQSASGSIHSAGLYGETEVKLSSGSLFLDALSGSEHNIQLSSGSAKIGGVSGKGKFSSASGNITLKAAELSGDLSFELSSGSLNLALPKGAAFILDAETLSGNINVKSSVDSYTLKERSSVVRPIGENPEFSVFANVGSGNITIDRR